jgi:hypothetical protein
MFTNRSLGDKGMANARSYDHDISARLDFIGLDPSARAQLKMLKPVIAGAVDEALDAFYGKARSNPSTSRHFSGDDHVASAKRRRASHWNVIADGEFGDSYARAVLAIGNTHARLGLEPRWYIGGYALIAEKLIGAIVAEQWPRFSVGGGNPAMAVSVSSLMKAILLDMDEAENSGSIMQDAVRAMAGIEKSSREISRIIGVIDEIAFQTNLLALNAGVEAARAGDAGRGFAVVAQEVRGLAQRSAEAAKEIKGLIQTSSSQVDDGVKLIDETGKVAERIVRQVVEIDMLVAEMASSTKEQSTGLSEINTAVSQMDQATQQNAAMVEQTTAAVHSLRAEAAELVRSIAGFSIGASGPSGGVRPTKPVKAPARTAAPRRAAAPGVHGTLALKVAVDADGWEEF